MSSLRVTRNAALAMLLAFVAAVSVFRAWGGLNRPGLYHDEKAYVLQSRIYSEFKWAEATPPVPELWEQVHVFVEPHYASRYPPGFPAALAVGSAMGVPGLVPIALTAVAAALMFLFGARLVGTWPAFVATALWIASGKNTVWRATYFSESMTCVLWLAWCWTAWRYRQGGRRRDLVATSLLVACAAITRPVTAIALAIPLIAILWSRFRTAPGRRDFIAAVAAGLVVCSVVPVWNHAVLDSWSTLPYAQYSARTFPFDMPTWKTNYSAPPRELPSDFQTLADTQRAAYERRALDSLPRVFAERANKVGADALPRQLATLRILAPLGLIAAGSAGIVALVSALLLVLAHLTMPHPIHWTIYYLDVFPVVAFGVIVALTRGGAWLARRAQVEGVVASAAPRVAFVTGLALMGAGATTWRPPRVDENAWMKSEVYFRSGLCALPPGQKIVFVHRRDDASPHHSLVDNDPRWQNGDVWIARDWDATRNRALLDVAPNRAAYYYDENAGWFARMNRDGTPTRDGVVNVLKVDLNAGHGLTCR